MTLNRILHVSLHIRKGRLDKTLAFYEALGLARLDRPVEVTLPGYWLGIGDAEIHLNGREVDDQANSSGPHPAHLCLGAQDIKATIAELERRGVDFSIAGSLETTQVWLRDPSGNVIELHEAPPS